MQNHRAAIAAALSTIVPGKWRVAEQTAPRQDSARSKAANTTNLLVCGVPVPLAASRRPGLSLIRPGRDDDVLPAFRR